MELELEKIAKNVLITRTIKGFTQEGLASKTGMTHAWIQKVEINGVTHIYKLIKI